MLRRLGLAVLLTAVLAVSVDADGVARTPSNTWITDGGIAAVVEGANGTVFLGGSFTHIGRPTGMFTILDRESGQPDLTVARLDGSWDSPNESRLVPDGAGGYLLAGPFTTLNGAPRSGLVRLTSAGQLDPSFAPTTTVLPLTVLVAGDRVYGLRFEPSSFRLVTLDLTSGRELSVSGPTRLSRDSRLFAGPDNTILVHDFLTLKAIDASTGAQRWETSAHRFVQSAGQAFIARGLSVLRLDVTAGTATPFVEAQPTTSCSPTCSVTLLTVHQRRVYMLGSFASVSGVSRPGSAAVDATSGAVLAWSAPTFAETFGPLAVWGDGDRILAAYAPWYAGKRTLLALDGVTGEPTGWRAYLLGDTAASLDLLVEATRIVAASSRLFGAGGIERLNLAQVSWPDGRPTGWSATLPDWNASLPGRNIRSMALAGNRLFAASDTRRVIHELDVTTGAARSTITFDGSVADIRARGNRLYTAGDFRQAGGQPRLRLAAFDVSSTPRLVEGWAPQVDGFVANLFTVAGVVLISGSFTTVDGAPRPGVAALDEATGALLPWNLESRGYANVSFDYDGQSVWLGGRFGQQAFDGRGAPSTYFAPRADLWQNAFLWPFATVFGDFLYIGGGARYAVHRTTGALSRWRPDVGPDDRVERWTRVGTGLVGHSFVRGGFRLYPRLAAPAAPSLRADVAGRTANLVWTRIADASSYVIEAGSASGASNLAVLDTGTTATEWSGNGPDGIYYVRVRAFGDGGSSAPSNELRIALGPGACGAPPAAPTALTFSRDGAVVTLRWTAPAGPVTRMIIQAGATAGATHTQLDAGLAESFSASAPSGTYFVRAVAENLCGTSGPSNELRVVVP